MSKRRTKGPTSERYIEATLELIAESGSSTGINLREISRRIGCAHTNVYNYFASRDDLMWAALRKTLRIYASKITQGLDASMSTREYFRKLFQNMIEWPLENNGLHRFTTSDPLDPAQIPKDIIDAVSRMKQWLIDTLSMLCGGHLSSDQATRIADILLAYQDGEILYLINGRVLPGEDIAARVVDNLELIFTTLSSESDYEALGKSAFSRGLKVSMPNLELDI